MTDRTVDLAAWLAARLAGLRAWQRRLARERAATARLPAQLAFARGERTLMSARDEAGGCTLVATDRALHHRTGSDSWSRLGWEQISTVSWDASASSLVVTGLAGAAPPRTIVPMRQRRTWPELAHERITHTRLVRQRVTLDDHRQVLIEVRRRPATDELRWVLVSGRLTPGDHNLRQQVERAVAGLYAELGLTLWSGPAGSGSAGSRPAGSVKADLDGEAAAGPGLRAEGGGVDADDGADDNQAEPVPAVMADPLRAESLERLEEAVHLAGRDRRTSVGDR